MLEERRQVAIEVAKKIKDAKSLCTKAVDQVSQAWEALIEDAELDKVTQDLCTVETEVTQLKNEMK